ncbi:MAG: dop [Acidobacteria bacterium]|nr:dop [Acidobacteriota bacterium]
MAAQQPGRRSSTRAAEAPGAREPLQAPAEGLVEKICGADVELGNFITGAPARRSLPGDAASALLAAIEGIAGRRPPFPSWSFLPSCAPVGRGTAACWGVARVADRQDLGRKFLATNGGCAYIDLDHLEICLPEVRSAWDHLACWHAMLRIVRSAQQAANARLDGARIHVLVNNSDGLGASYGSHLDVLVTRRAWDDMFRRRLHHLLFLAAYQASSIVFTGQGKVGSENGAPAVRFQLAQRADFIETLVGPQTTYNRPLVNSRDEPLCGLTGANDRDGRGGLARLHVIAYDSTLSHVSHLLKVGVLQLVLAMIEAERVNPALLLDDPVGAMRRWSHDPTLRHRERLIAGGSVTAVGLQQRFLEEALRFAEEGRADPVVPRAAEILALWADTLSKLEAGDLEALAGRLDWVLKLSVLRSLLVSRPGLSWASPEVKHLDHLFASLDPDEGVFWAYERSGLVERVAGEDDIARFGEEPPADTRAWTRTMLLRAAGPARVTEVNWDVVRLRAAGTGRGATWRIDLDDPRAGTRQADGAVFEGGRSLEEIAGDLATCAEGQATADHDRRGVPHASA